MAQVEIRRINRNAYVEAPWTKPVLAFQVNGDVLDRLVPDKVEDDLGEYTAAFYQVAEIQFAVQRHSNEPAHEFTFVCDVVAAKRQQVDVRELAAYMLRFWRVAPYQVTWRASEEDLEYTTGAFAPEVQTVSASGAVVNRLLRHYA